MLVKKEACMFKKTYILFVAGIFMNALAQNPGNLVNIAQINPAIKLDIRYATTNNFTKKTIYTAPKCYLCKDIAMRIDAVQKELETVGLGLLIFDGYRPVAATQIFWDLIGDERYVANPIKGSRHNRGCTVDCTLVDSKGKLLDMGTEFDDFTEKAHVVCTDFSQEILSNRKLLQDIMHKHGFQVLDTEWWHFDVVNWKDYPIIDTNFELLS